MHKKSLAHILAISLSTGLFASAAQAADDRKPEISKEGAITSQNLSREQAAPNAVTSNGPAAARPNQGPAAGQGEGALYGWSDRDRMDTYEQDRTKLKDALAQGQSRDDYQRILHENGYVITAVQMDSPRALEYEVVGNGNTYEVRMGFDDDQAKASDIEVDNNMWRSSDTAKAMRDETYRPATTGVPYSREQIPTYRDDDRMAQWNDERNRLQRVIEPGGTVEETRRQIEQEGYQITAVNDREADEVEYEIVKGDTSYELTLEREGIQGMVSSIEISPNLWHAEGTERALGEE